MKLRRAARLSCVLMTGCVATAVTPVEAQTSSAAPRSAAPTADAQASQGEQAAAAGVQEVVVTARKREESDLSVPGSITAVSSAEIQREQIHNVFDLAAHVPSLLVSNSATANGGAILLRGIGTVSVGGSTTIDQSVAYDIDGVPLSRGNVLRLGNYDLNQIEILKGPQALFFGKNASAGVISFKSNQPTATFDSAGTLSYEPYTRDRLAEAYVSGPLTDSLGARLFVHYDQSDGDKQNLAALALPANKIVPGSVFAPTSDRAYGTRDAFVRGTVIYHPNDRLKIRLEASYDDNDGPNVAEIKERFYCPQGAPQTALAAKVLGGGANTAALAKALAVDDCKLNGTIFQGGINPAFFQAPFLPGKKPDGDTRDLTTLGVAEVDYALTKDIDLTSVTSYARLGEVFYGLFTYAPFSLPPFASYENTLYEQLSEEARATTHFAGPLNLMVGVFYQDITFRTVTASIVTPPFNQFLFRIPNQVYSAFGQAIWKITPNLELAGGARVTSENKRLILTRDGVVQPTANPSVTFHNISPEVTLTWRPSSDLTTYVAYKTGFKSGGYAATLATNGPPLPTSPLSKFDYGPEDAKGFEGGVKAELFDRSLRIDASAYEYKYNNLQVSNFDASTGVAILRVVNAAAAQQYGVEVQSSYYPRQISGLQLSAYGNYNDSYYTSFNSPCWTGQSIAEGCNINLVNGAFTQQNLKGRQFPTAPLWVGSLGFTQSLPIADKRLEFGADAVYRSSYNAAADLNPGAFESPSTTLDAQIRLVDKAHGWEIGIYGKNLTNVYRVVAATNAGFTGNAAATGTVNGGLLARPDLVGNTNLGREVYFQIVVRPSAWIR